MELPDRFWAKTQIEDRGYETPCRVWTGYVTPKGYGRYQHEGRLQYAHRVAYEAEFGPIPEEVDGDRAVIDHKCRVRSCVNTAHMEVVTNRENVLRGDTAMATNAAKTHCANGHEFTGENTGRTARGHRVCLTCADAHREARNAARREERAAKPPKSPKTQCKHGHELTTENTYVGPRGRECRICRRAADERRRSRKRKS
ncbi:HNH endonuclease signature motif containing protein [Streptomyces milbemycinicus]|uniref:HNH endonuclease signature motif containing protein n=1 Tax=Streptomyces milbemycinicus TaxID=476552 RepID=UPI0013026BE8|nr:HNH endonuclease signature motif containing protein [Streptomyces milbemycinicus]